MVCLVAAAAVVGLHAPGLRAQERIFLQVVDQRTGAVVTDLRPDDVVVHEDGAARRVLDVRFANLPMTVTALVDNSAAAGQALIQLREGLLAFFDRLPPNQEVSLMTLAGEPRWIVPPTLDRDELRAGVDSIPPDLGSAPRFLDGVIEASERIDAEEAIHRPVIVIVSADGIDASADLQTRYEGLVPQLLRNDITVHMVLLSEEPDGVSVQYQVGQSITSLTLGYFVAVTVPAAVEQHMVAIADSILARNRELASQHRILYERPAGVRPERTRVLVTRLGVRYTATDDGRLGGR